MGRKEAEKAVGLRFRESGIELSGIEQDQVADLKNIGATFWEKLDQLGQSRELSLAKTHIEEAVMWGVKHLTG